ncbi:MAG TPA: hypothetical protein VK173_01790 [Lacibacter sp.]|nr:hypothetical protein [Lacibacter sp.]
MKNKYFFFLVLFALISCQGSNTSEETQKPEANINVESGKKTQNEIISNVPYYWAGTINKTIPVFLHFTFVDSMFIGELTYLNTKRKEPIFIIGSIEDDSSYRLLEFENSGNISGVLSLNHADNSLDGAWYSTKNDSDFEISLSKKDTVLPSKSFNVDRSDIYGTYAYSYGEKGYQGTFDINKTAQGDAEISAFSVTRDPSRNIAELEKDTISILGNSFTYKQPSSDSCSYKIQLYKKFLVVKYLSGPGDCFSQYGVNADITGIYLRTSKSIIDLKE